MAYTPKFDNTPEGKRLEKKYNQLKKEFGPGPAKNLLWPGRAGLKAKAKTKKNTKKA